MRHLSTLLIFCFLGAGSRGGESAAPTKPEGPSPPAEEAVPDKQNPDKAPKAETPPPAAPATPKASPDTPPKFPLPPETFAGMREDHKNMKKEDWVEGMHEREIEFTPMVAVLDAVQSSSQEYLKKNIDPKATFNNVMNHPEQYHGHVVQFQGTLKTKGSREIKIGSNTIYCGVVADVMKQQLVMFRSLEPIPVDMKDGSSVELIGVYLKRQIYRTVEQPGEIYYEAPLIYIRKLEPFVEAPTASSLSDNIALGIGILACIGFGFYFFMRTSDKSIRPNHFSRLRPDKKAPSRNRLFPPAK